MTDLTPPALASSKDAPQADLSAARIRRRYRAEARFRLYGIAAISTALAMLAVLLGTIVWSGASAFLQTEIALEVPLEAAAIDPDGTRDPAILSGATYRKIVRAALRVQFPEVSGRLNNRELQKIISIINKAFYLF